MVEAGTTYVVDKWELMKVLQFGISTLYLVLVRVVATDSEGR